MCIVNDNGNYLIEVKNEWIYKIDTDTILYNIHKKN